MSSAVQSPPRASGSYRSYRSAAWRACDVVRDRHRVHAVRLYVRGLLLSGNKQGSLGQKTRRSCCTRSSCSLFC